MKKLFVLYLILSVLTANALGNVDIVAVDGIPFVSWCTDMAYIAACPSGVVTDPVSFGEIGANQFLHASICYSTPAAGDRLILACTPEWIEMLDDTVYLLNPQNLEVINQRSLNSTELGHQIWNTIGEMHLPRYCDGSDTFTFVVSIGDCTTGYGVNYLASASLSYPEAGPMVLSDSLSTMIFSPACMHPPLLGPVSLPTLKTLSMSCYHGWTPISFEGWIRSHLHQEDPSTGAMLSHTISYHSSNEAFSMLLSAFGSSASEAVCLWSDSTMVQFYSVFVDSIAPASTDVFPFPYPTHLEPAAMTRNPSDSGMLLAWYYADAGEIRIRHWENEWNDFDHIVASGQPSVSTGNIAVCSVDDGYWVAWLPEGADQPVLAFVDRGTVTGIVAFEEPSVTSLILHPSVNPFRESVTLTVEGDPLPESLDVFDITGRLIRVLWNDSVSNTFFWDGENTSGQEVPPGTYFIQASSAGMHLTVPLVKL